MDRGAHFYRCDFQVHTPRDTNWSGPRPATPEERMAYAERFVAACRQRGLNAVALTDHHDTGFFSHIKAAAKAETDEYGNEIPDSQKLVVFPGMELTLGVPCQALLILDSEFPLNLLASLYTVLAVSQNDHSEPIHAPVVRLDDINNFGNLCEMLDRIEYLRGRYIVLPNVSEGGNSTVLRSGFAAAYKLMPCVGGYLDGPVTQLGRGNGDILNGKNKEYGFKALGLFPTSDNRRDDFRDLGDHTTWVKWATPTAEALRQACLARETRISHEPPALPAIVVRSLSVSNSRFLGPIDIEFNDQFNCLIGGRGTGKSTILEYLRWALCDQPPDVSNDELPDFQSKRSGLIEKTLVPFQAVLTVEFIVNEVRHVVRRNARTSELTLKIGSGEFQECSEQDIRDLLPIQAYSQKQLSAVGVRTDELIRFIRASIKSSLNELSGKLNSLKAEIRKAYSEMQAKRALQRDIERDQLQLDSLTKQVEALKKGLSGVSNEDRKVLDDHNGFLAEEQTIKAWDRSLDRLRAATTALDGELTTCTSGVAQPSGKERLSEIEKRLQHLFEQVRVHVDAIVGLLAENGEAAQKLGQSKKTWDTAHGQHQKEYEAAKQRSSAHETYLKQIAETEERNRKLRDSIAERMERLSRMGNPEDAYSEARKEWLAFYEERGKLLEDKCNELTALSSASIRATLRRGAGLRQAQERVTAILAGTKVRGKRIEETFDSMSNADDPIHEWTALVGDLEKLAGLSPAEESSVELPETPALSAAGFTSGELERIARKITVEEWIETSLLELEDVPVFEYRIREDEYIAFADASAGQQATALLRVLLNQEGPPLLIDQPEEDLDNQVILEIVREIWKAKRKRQIIFSSHNANIVVNGDADLVVCCDYRTSGDQSWGKIKCQGAIDVEEIKSEITKVMEGGKDAFRLRKEKYGF